MTQHNLPQDRGETSLKALLRLEFKEGMAASRDPSNAGKPDPITRKETTIYSPWYTRTCPECKQKFREGDMVRLCPQCGRAYHDDDQYQLYCWQTHFATYGVCQPARDDPFSRARTEGCPYQGPPTFPDEAGRGGQSSRAARRLPQVTGQFLRGLEAVWTPFGAEAVFEVEAGSSLVGHKCPWCRFQIRAGDRVVKCPCGQCNTYFHDDIFRHLACWDEWNGSQGNDYCPTSGARIERDARPSPAEGEHER